MNKLKNLFYLLEDDAFLKYWETLRRKGIMGIYAFYMRWILGFIAVIFLSVIEQYVHLLKSNTPMDLSKQFIFPVLNNVWFLFKVITISGVFLEFKYRYLKRHQSL